MFLSELLRVPHKCRFYPTCSQYSYDAISSYGILEGGLLTINRILHCNPLHHGETIDDVNSYFKDYK